MFDSWRETKKLKKILHEEAKTWACLKCAQGLKKTRRATSQCIYNINTEI